MQKLFCVASAALLGLSLTAACAASSDLEKVMKERGLSEKDVLAAAKTYQPSGRKDDFIVFFIWRAKWSSDCLWRSVDENLQIHRRFHPRALARIWL